MFHVLDNVPIPPLLDFGHINPSRLEVTQRVMKALEKRSEIVSGIAAIAKDQQPTNFQVSAIAESLPISMDLLEIATSEGVEIMPKYKGFLKNHKKILNITTDPEVVFCTDLIYLRIALSFAYLKSVKFETANIRKAIHDFSVQMDFIKKATDKIVQAALRTHRLVRFENIVFQGLKNSGRIYEINPKTIRAIDRLVKLNLASILIIKTMASPLNPDKVEFLSKLAKHAYQHVLELKKFFTQNFNEVLQSLIQFLDISEVFYKCFVLYCVLRLNLYEDQTLIKRTKDFKLAYVENKDISIAIQKYLAELKAKAYNSKESFNVEENRRFCIAFFDNFGTNLFAEAIKHWEILKDDIGNIKATPIQSLVDGLNPGEDFVENYLDNMK